MASSPASPRANSLATIIRPGGLSGRQTAAAAALLGVVIVLSWIFSIQQARGMEDMAGTMGLGFVPFLVMWGPMVAAMMFPTVGPTAVAAVEEPGSARGPVHLPMAVRIGTFLVGYLLVWMAFGALIYGLLAGLGGLVDLSQRQARWLAAGVYAIAGLYQLTWPKDACRDRCRSCRCSYPSDGAGSRFFETVRVSVTHGVTCIGCCWGYMVVLIAVGMTNLVAMALLTVVIFVERHAPSRPVLVSRVAGVVLLAVAVATPFVSWLHPGLADSGMHM